MKVKLPHLRKPPQTKFFYQLIDQNGILQHSRLSFPDQVFGYSLDDNARALIVAALHFRLFKDLKSKKLITKLLGFIQGQQTASGDFHNYLFVSFGQKFRTHELAEDAFGQVIWALGLLVFLDLDPQTNQSAWEILKKALPLVPQKTSLRPQAYSLLGLCYLSQKDLGLQLGDSLKRAFAENQSPDWLWFENTLTYANALLPWALISAGQAFAQPSFRQTGLAALEFLLKKTTEGKLPSPIGQRGWFSRHQPKARFDQQPIEAGYLVAALLKAYQATPKKRYLKLAQDWFAWFHGYNLPGLSLIDKKDGGCYDGLEPWKVNLNKGAESTICYLLAYLKLALAIKKNGSI